LLLVAAITATATAQDARTAAATAGMTRRSDLEVVECLLPGQVRQLGSRTYLTARRPVRTTTADCRIRGGEYVAYDRADYKSALRIWMEAAQSGDPEAQTNVGEIYERGIGGTPNYEAAVIWYQKAADQGYSRALFDLGTLHEQGLGVPADRLKALNLYRQAWGLPQDSLIYTSAAETERQALRTQLDRVIAEKDQQLQLLRKQLEQTEQKLRAVPPAQQRSTQADQEIAALKSWIARLEGERRANADQRAALPAATREAGAEAASAPLDLAAQARMVKGLDLGRYYALVIGNQEYQVLDDLETPRTDAERTARILKEKYGFTVQRIQDADDVAMLRALNELNRVLKPNDNVLVYYAGHGTRLKTASAEAGYWLPVNADRPPNDTFWVPNEQITAHLARLPAKRVLVVSDSCYAGLLSTDPAVTLFGTEANITWDYVKYKLPRRSRLLIASGGDEPVLDAGGQGSSVFARAFIDVLSGNESILSSPSLFVAVRERMKQGTARNGFQQSPELKSIKAAGHEVGDFFFVPLNIRS
jgi:hypothetical protein